MAFVWNRALAKRIGYAAAGLVSIAAGTFFVNFVKQTPTGESATRNIICWGSSSGSQVCVRETAALAVSGSLTVQGVKIGTGATATFAQANGIYVNVAGDTMTGKLLVNLTSGTDALEVRQTMSGAEVHAEQILSASGSLAVDGASALHAVTATSIYGDSVVGQWQLGGSGTLVWEGAGSGNTLLLNGGRINTARRYATFVLFGSGTTTATGANIFGNYEVPFNGTIAGAYANVGAAANDGLTTVIAKIGGVSAFSTNLTIDATELTSRTAATPVSINTATDDFVAGNYITFAVNAPASVPAKALNVTLVFDIVSTP